eukprot:scaffold762_cov363-Pavlova_lutheri.AAC.19
MTKGGVPELNMAIGRGGLLSPSYCFRDEFHPTSYRSQSSVYRRCLLCTPTLHQPLLVSEKERSWCCSHPLVGAHGCGPIREQEQRDILRPRCPRWHRRRNVVAMEIAPGRTKAMLTEEESEGQPLLTVKEVLEVRAKVGGGASEQESGLVRRLWRCAKLVHWTWHAGLMIASVANVLVGAQVGKVAGNFYEAFGKQDGRLFRNALLMAGGWYTLCVLVASTRDFLAEYVALRARISLTELAHHRYCQSKNFYWMDKNRVDNPDQRIASDVGAWATNFAEVLKVCVASPFTILYYSVLVYQYAGSTSVLLVYSFFIIGVMVQKTIVSPTAKVVFNQERMEGDFRAKHLHLSDAAETVAIHDGGAIERAALECSFKKVANNQRLLLFWHLLLGACTKVLEYAGAALNYICVAIPVFAGKFAGQDPAEVSKFVSNASFANLSLIYSFTEVLDLGKRFSTLAGLTKRVGELLDHFDHIQKNEKEYRPFQKEAALHREKKEEIEQLLKKDYLLLAPAAVGRQMEASVHTFPTSEGLSVHSLFPDAPSSDLLLILTNQEAALDLAPRWAGSVGRQPGVHKDWGARASEEMDRLLERFLSWAKWMCTYLHGRGYWADAVDPRTGYALRLAGTNGRSSVGSKYDEVTAAQTLLGYPVEFCGAAPVISHPMWGTCCYPASMATSAPLETIQDAFEKASAVFSRVEADPGVSMHSDTDSIWVTGCGLPLLTLRKASYRTPSGNPAVFDLSRITVKEKGSLLITGPSGCGKSTFVKVLAGLWPLTDGSLVGLSASSCGSEREETSVTPSTAVDVLYLPQDMYLGPGRTLRAILSYPSDKLEGFGDRALLQVLRDVGLLSLLNRMQGNLDAEAAWDSILSPGQKQRILFARILLQVPKLVVLDESTSALPEMDEERLYELLCEKGIARISVGHRPALASFHELLLRLHGNGSWDIQHTQISDESQHFTTE